MKFDDPKPVIPVIALMAVTFFWGSSFYTISSALEHTNPVVLSIARFTLSALLLIPILGAANLANIPKGTWLAGAYTGIPIFLTYALNTLGLMSIPSSMAGFLLALYVPLTPFVYWVVYKKLPGVFAFAGGALAFTGLVLLANPFNLSFENNLGEWLTIAGALCCAIQIVVIGRFAPKCKAKELAFTQIVWTAVFSAASLPLAEYTQVIPLKETEVTASLVLQVLWLGAVVAVVQVLLSWAQRYVPPSRAAVIFSMESVFAALIGYAAGENLGVLGLAGGALIVLGTITTESKALIDEARRKVAKKYEGQ